MYSTAAAVDRRAGADVNHGTKRDRRRINRSGHRERREWLTALGIIGFQGERLWSEGLYPEKTTENNPVCDGRRRGTVVKIMLPENSTVDSQGVHAGLLNRGVAWVRMLAKPPRAVDPTISDRRSAENALPVECGAADQAALIASEHEVGGPFQLSLGIVGAAI